VRTADWKALQGSVDDLAVLAEMHRDVNVRKMSEKLRMVIATHGAVLKETEELRGKTEQVIVKLVNCKTVKLPNCKAVKLLKRNCI
jgi:translation initiation factor 1 (eIF-1/SUI1)